jgi:Skp family chaperone for outer membrane proteins
LKKNLALPTMVLGLAVLAAAQTPPSPVPTKVGIINMAGAIYSTYEGKEASARLQARFAPVKEKLDKRQADIQAKTDQLRKGAATMSTEAQANLKAEIDRLTTSYNRDMEDGQADAEQEQTKVINELGAKMMEILNKYGADNTYAVVIDVSDQNSPVRFAAAGVDITNDIIKLYDQKYPPAAAKPAVTGGAAVQAPKPPATPPAPAKKP